VGCGEEERPSPTTSTAADPSTPSTSAEGSPAEVRLEVTSVTPGEPRDFTDTASVQEGDRVQIRARVSGADPGGSPVRLSLASGPRERLAVRVLREDGQPEGEPSLVESDSEMPIRLAELRYVCSLPPRIACPEDAQMDDDSYDLTFSVTPESPPIILTAVIEGSGGDVTP
jgi:hypothetical protein